MCAAGVLDQQTERAAAVQPGMSDADAGLHGGEPSRARAGVALVGALEDVDGDAADAAREQLAAGEVPPGDLLPHVDAHGQRPGLAAPLALQSDVQAGDLGALAILRQRLVVGVDQPIIDAGRGGEERVRGGQLPRGLRAARPLAFRFPLHRITRPGGH